MKITIDNTFMTIEKAPRVRSDIKEFKARYTEGDLKHAFCDQTGDYTAYCADIVAVSGSAFPGGTFYNDETQFSFCIVCRDYDKFIELRFYCDMDLSINTGDLLDYRGISIGKKMYSIDVFDRRA